MYREFIDSREGFDAMTRAEYDNYLDMMEEKAVLERQEEEDEEYDDTDDYNDDDGQPSEYTEWQDYMGGDDWDHGQYDEW